MTIIKLIKIKSCLNDRAELTTRSNITAKPKWAMASLLLLQSFLSVANAEQASDIQISASLSISPEQCIALHQGQVCYQNVVLEWRSEQSGDFCLFTNSDDKSLHCWENSNIGKLTFDFQSPQSVVYRLRASNSAIDLAKVQMTVAWVYSNKKKRRASWRLF